VDFEIEVRWVVETVGPPRFNRQNLYSGVSRCSRQAVVVVGTFLGGARLLATADVIFCRRLEVIVSVFLVFERAVFLNIGKKKKCLVFQWQKKWKNGQAIENLKGIMVFLFC